MMLLVQLTERTHRQQLLLNFSNEKCFGTLLAKEIESLNKVLKTVKNRLRLFLEV
jgi:hypothetical protein